MFKQQILEDLEKAVKDLGFESSDIVCSIPKNSEFGDYTSNIALQLAKQESSSSKQNPVLIAKQISKKLKVLDYLEKVEVAGGGFINFYIKPQKLMENLHQVCDYACFIDPKPKLEETVKQKIFIEYAGFNALKPIHVGHLRNITLGESITRLLEANNQEVFRATYTSDIGLPAAKVVWGILQSPDKFKATKKKTLREKAEFLGRIYVKANTSFEDVPEVKTEIDQINTRIYQRDEKLVPIWQEALKWTFDYFNYIYELVGTKFDKEFLESEAEGLGSQIVRDNIGKIFKHDEGAIIFPGEEFGLHNRVFITSSGNPTYEAKDMGLAKLEYSAYQFDLAIHIVANDQDDYFKVVFKALDLLDHDLASKERHLSYGYVTLPSGKMSSRKGNVVTLEQLYDLVRKEVGNIVNSPESHGSLSAGRPIRSGMTTEEKNEIVKIVSLGAIKFAILKYASHTEITFDLEKSVSLMGDSGPYVQYTYARAKSVLRNAQYSYQPTEIKGDLEKEELTLLRQIEHFDCIVKEAATNYAPHLVANFLVDFARNFNLFYQKHPIAKHEKSELRLALTCAVAVRIKQGLYLLGIEAPERM